MVVHTAVGTYQGTLNWMRNPAAQVSSYFVVDLDGTIAQPVDLADKAWTQAAGNEAWIGVENAGNSTIALTADQVAANAKILAWLHATYGVPLELTTDPINGRGLGYHSMGGSAWSPAGHQCPGPIIVAQLPAILAAAIALVNPPEEEVTPAQMAELLKAIADLEAKIPELVEQAIQEQLGGYVAGKYTPGVLITAARQKLGLSKS